MRPFDVQPPEDADLAIIVRRKIRAPVQRVFDAWTQPEHLRRWWGPGAVSCPEAEIDLRVGGQYRIANLLPDGSVLWIRGEFQLVSPPDKLVYTWSSDPQRPPTEKVTVRFEALEDGTEVIVVHEHMPNAQIRDLHEHGWIGCLDGLERYALAGI